MTVRKSEAVQTVDLTGRALGLDPFRTYSRIRERGTLARGVVPGADAAWMVLGHDDVKAVLHDSRLVTNVAYVPGAAPSTHDDRVRRAGGVPQSYLKYMRGGVPGLEGSDHARIRGSVSGAFTPRRVAALRPRIERIAEALLDRLPDIAEDGVVDVLRHFAYPLPLTVICEMVGVPEGDRMRWREWSASLSTGAGGDALRHMADHIHDLIERRRFAPGDDLISQLLNVQESDPPALTDTEIVSLVIALLIAGHETTAHLISNGTLALLTHPDQLDLFRRHQALRSGAVHELLRLSSPVLGAFARYATEELTIAGTSVHKGEVVLPILAAANHDPRMFSHPEELDISRVAERKRETHLAFGHGRHYCLGAALAHLEGEVAFGILLRRFPNLTLAVGQQDLERVSVRGSWRLRTLPVRLGAEVARRAACERGSDNVTEP